MKKVILIACAVVVLGGVGGCSTPLTASQGVSSTPALNIHYSTPQVQEDLLKLGLSQRFNDYWQAHSNRNWAANFLMEDIKGNITEKFYVAYHDKAWPLERITVIEVKGDSNAATVSASITFANPEKPGAAEASSQAVIDSWVKVEDAWKHVVSDPMLSAIKH